MDSGLPRSAPKWAIADLGTKMPISGKPEIGGPGMSGDVAGPGMMGWTAPDGISVPDW